MVNWFSKKGHKSVSRKAELSASNLQNLSSPKNLPILPPAKRTRPRDCAPRLAGEKGKGSHAPTVAPWVGQRWGEAGKF